MVNEYLCKLLCIVVNEYSCHVIIMVNEYSYSVYAVCHTLEPWLEDHCSQRGRSYSNHSPTTNCVTLY